MDTVVQLIGEPFVLSTKGKTNYVTLVSLVDKHWEEDAIFTTLKTTFATVSFELRFCFLGIRINSQSL